MLLDKNKIFITGILGILGSVLVGIGEFLLHFSPHIIGNADNYQFFQFVPKNSLITGHFLAVLGVPFYFLGYYHIYKMLEKGNKKLASIVFGLGILAFTIGGFWITSRAFLGTIVHLQNDIDTNIYQEILDNYTLISESLVQILRVIILLLSVFFSITILKGGTYYKKWMAIFNPIVLLISVFTLYFISPQIGKYIAPIAMNVVHFIVFSLSLYQLKKINQLSI
ncbi:DUF6796 family protein [Polaribacter sp. AHE13PA]|jgi:hypothetical protein|uniref:DUF6796 family protein n=1 Tax=unclassified Polaribacter TaxID=196858 RepID=UPI001C4E91CF|nr:DUF6796 family protein [Polaribacter sp. AHE13PA]QXP66721.1 hypothetical protein H0I28_16420 [Polaribacter sp. AHE13PA]